jgi:hypothetical protein
MVARNFFGCAGFGGVLERKGLGGGGIAPAPRPAPGPHGGADPTQLTKRRNRLDVYTAKCSSSIPLVSNGTPYARSISDGSALALRSTDY